MHPTEAELHDHADGLLSDGDAAWMDGHLAECGECAAQAARIHSLAAALSALPRAGEPARDLWPAVAQRTVDAPDRVIPFPAAARLRRSPSSSVALQRAAAAVLLFVGGVGVGRVTRAPAEPATTIAVAEQPATPMEAAAQVQRAGTEYVAAVAAFASLTDSASEGERAQGREAAFAAMYGAAKELTRVPARDSSATAIYRTVSGTRHLVAAETRGNMRF
ncbi:MAG TPA: zf-HC2 domain-containing protein [Longimicrobium sp.]|nr:zf-HC2 domain-containing protein [Longimicrobium sp.]